MLCMHQCFSQFREKVYQVEFGSNMGIPLSQLIAECSMANFELSRKKGTYSKLTIFLSLYIESALTVTQTPSRVHPHNHANTKHITLYYKASTTACCD